MTKEERRKQDPFFVDDYKFIKLLEFIQDVRQAQKKYFETRSKDDLEKSKLLEQNLDKALNYYLSNKEKINDVPF